jgi:hypothetical protein
MKHWQPKKLAARGFRASHLIENEGVCRIYRQHKLPITLVDHSSAQNVLR